MRLSFKVNRLIAMWMPELLRRPKHLAWLQVMFSPLTKHWAEVLAYRAEKLYEATITGATNRLQKALQDKFNQGIYIIQPLDYLDSAWIYTEDEPHFPEFDFLEEENHTPAEYDYLEEEYDPEIDFIVRVPNVAITLVADIKSLLKKYVLAGKRYKIEMY